MPKLLTEVIDHVQYLVEKKGDNGEFNHFLTGKFMQAGIPNKNHRIYPITVLQNEANRFITEHITPNRAYGELNHPQGPNINLDRVAIHIKSLKQEGNDFVGKALIASTPMGSIVKGLVQDGANLGVSSRALGSLKPVQENLSEVQDDLRLLAIDVVADPSAPDAYVNAIHEQAEWVYDTATGLWTEQVVAQHQKAVKTYSTRAITEAQTVWFKQFLDSIGKR